MKCARVLSLVAPFALTLAIAGCSNDEPTGGAGTDGSDPGAPGQGGEGDNGGGGDDDNGGSETLPKSCEPWRVQMVADCNFVDTYAANTKNGPPAAGEDPYRPTEACKATLASVLTLSGAWTTEANKEARDGVLAALHTLFFHPLLMPSDQSFLVKGAGAPTFAEGEMLSADVKPIPASYDNVLRRKLFNEKLFERFTSSVNQIAPAELTANMETSYGGHIAVDTFFARKAYLASALPELANKYVVARAFYHELRHTEGYLQHTSCSDLYADEKECDDHLSSSGYGGGAQIAHALTLGAIYTRRPNTVGSVDLGIPAHIFRAGCTYATEKVNEVAEYMKASTRGEPCGPTGEIYEGIVAHKYVPPTVAANPPVLAEPDHAWTCGDSVLPSK